MKNRFLFGAAGLLSASVIALLGLVGCGGGGGDSSSTPTSSITGSVQASKVVGAQVCVKGTSVCDTTDTNGRFRISGYGPGTTLSVEVGSTPIGSITVNSSSIDITPKVLANNETIAQYIGAILHKVCGDNNMTATVCNVGGKTLTLSANSLIEEIIQDLNNTNSVTVSVDGNNVTTSLADIVKYATANPEMVSNEITFAGAASVGDYATFSYNSENATISYHLQGQAFPNGKDGSKTLSNLYGNVFFTDTDTAQNLANMIANNNFNLGAVDFYFFSGSLGVARLPSVDANASFIVGMQTPPSIDPSLIVNKRFNYIDFDANGSIGNFSIIDVNGTAGDINGTWTNLIDGSNGTWDINGTHLDIKDNSGVVAHAVIRPPVGNGRAGFILDKVQGGFGLGVEAQLVTASEISGEFFYLDKGNNWACFGRTTISDNNDNNASTAQFTFQDDQCFGTTADNNLNSPGLLELNPTVTIGRAQFELKGIAKVSDTEYAFIDPESGYYISVDMNASDPMISIGSNKPLQ